MSDPMIRIEHISKQYRLGQIGGTTLREELQRLNARIRHKEDPTKRIGARSYEKGETFLALDDVTFDVMSGERVGIIGRNGAGKSTLLKLISRVTAPTGGSIGLNGRVASMLEVGTGFHGELTGRENIYMNGAILGMSKREIDAKMEDIIDFSECRQFIDTPVKRYSSGMYVKLAFAVAAHLDSEIMIMDEVLAVGDMAFQKKCLDKMSDVSATQGRTILYVSHNMNTIRQLCDRCVVLDHGKLVYHGDVEEAIRIYMDLGGASFSRQTDLTEAPRNQGISRKILFTGADINRDNNVYTCEENVHVTFDIDSTVDYDDVRLMLILFYQDGTRIGKTESGNFSVKKGANRVEVNVPCRGLADGSYYYEISILQRSHSFSREKCDSIPNVLPFNISNQAVFGVNGGKWSSRYWGHIMLEPAEVVAVNSEAEPGDE